MKIRNTYNSCSTFLKPTKLDIQYFYGLFKILRSFGKFGDVGLQNLRKHVLYMKACNTNNSCSTFLKPTKLNIQYFYGLFKILRSFGKYGDLPKFEDTRFYT